ncbi:MAG: hypothetical protein ACRCZF_18795, partial [Gemmataceae bacterium]
MARQLLGFNLVLLLVMTILPALHAGGSPDTERDLAKFIDDQIATENQAAQRPLAPPADDAEFLRRASLDLI